MTPLPALTGKLLVTALAKTLSVSGAAIIFCGTLTAAVPLSLFMPVKP